MRNVYYKIALAASTTFFNRHCAQLGGRTMSSDKKLGHQLVPNTNKLLYSYQSAKQKNHKKHILHFGLLTLLIFIALNLEISILPRLQILSSRLAGLLTEYERNSTNSPLIGTPVGNDMTCAPRSRVTGSGLQVQDLTGNIFLCIAMKSYN